LCVVALAVGLGCSSTRDEDPFAAPEPSAAPGVSNAFPIARGDVPSARVRASARLAAARSPSSPPSVPVPAGTLVLYDETGMFDWVGELYAMAVGSLVGRFGPWAAKPVLQYEAGEMAAYAGVVYVGSTFDEPLPVEFLDDVLSATRPVVWIDDNIWQLAARAPAFAETYGFEPAVYDRAGVSEILYKGTTLTRYAANDAGIMTYASVTTAKVLAEAVRADRTRFPWALRGKNLFYVGENPLAYVTPNDRYLAFCDLLLEAFARPAPERHRALVRIEDVSPASDPGALRAIADCLASESVPFAIATIPMYLDPTGSANDGVPRSLSMRESPDVVSALAYMIQRGGTLVLHGYTHQLGLSANPYSGVTADDFEFFAAHVDAAKRLVYDGPVPGDSRNWAARRVNAGLQELEAAGLPAPKIFELPFDAASAEDARAVRRSFETVYHRGLYFGGLLRGGRVDYRRSIRVMYPYPGQDVFGFSVVPENLGSYLPFPTGDEPARVVADLLQTAHANRVVRDGFASFYFHPRYDISVLRQLVQGIRAEGYTFVDARGL
jgi:uncharacterized protein YdaL